jgi:FkbM family methyltransferase
MIRKTVIRVLGFRTIEKIKSLVKNKERKKLIKKRREFYLQFLNPNDIYYDVGANYGNRIEPIIKDKIKIIAIEPQQECIRYLTKKYKDRITIIPKGLAEKKGVQSMYLSDAHTISSFSKDWIDAIKKSGRFSDYNWNKIQETEIETLDNLISKYGKPQFIKIDVEGYEYEVLKGLSQSITTISFEYTIPERKKSIIDCIDRIIKISNQNEVFFNYSIGESMEWTLDKWVSATEMKKEINLEKFIKSGFGDIYAKTTP